MRKLFSAANALLSIPRCPRPLLLSRLLSTYALAHADYLWQALDHLRPHGVRLVSSTVCQVLKRALGLHFSQAPTLRVPPRKLSHRVFVLPNFAWHVLTTLREMEPGAAFVSSVKRELRRRVQHGLRGSKRGWIEPFIALLLFKHFSSNLTASPEPWPAIYPGRLRCDNCRNAVTTFLFPVAQCVR